MKKFTLINRAGRVRVFYVQAVAELYQQLEGGVLITAQVLAFKTEGQMLASSV